MSALPSITRISPGFGPSHGGMDHQLSPGTDFDGDAGPAMRKNATAAGCGRGNAPRRRETSARIDEANWEAFFNDFR